MPAKRVDFKHIKEAADFLAVLRHYNITPVGKGVERQALCPFHRETKPSFKVNLGRKVFHCFGCNQGGDVIKFVCLAEGLDPEETENIRTAAKQLALICGIEAAPPTADPMRRARTAVGARRGTETTEEPSAAETPSPEPPTASDGPVNPPLKPEVVERIEAKLIREHPYLAERGLSPDTITAFGLGYHPSGRGLMQNRLCIPVHNATGELVAYLGRWVGPDETIPEHEGKYKLPPGFQKERVLYNLHRVRDRRHLVVVEGPFSVFRLHTLGVPAVALLGHHLAPAQLELLVASGVRQLTFLLDGDAAGRSAVPEMMALLSRSPIRAKFAVLPDGTQPDTVDEAELLDILALRR